jgi:hypothetical protein
MENTDLGPDIPVRRAEHSDLRVITIAVLVDISNLPV